MKILDGTAAEVDAVLFFVVSPKRVATAAAVRDFGELVSSVKARRRVKGGSSLTTSSSSSCDEMLGRADAVRPSSKARRRTAGGGDGDGRPLTWRIREAIVDIGEDESKMTVHLTKGKGKLENVMRIV